MTNRSSLRRCSHLNKHDLGSASQANASWWENTPSAAAAAMVDPQRRQALLSFRNSLLLSTRTSGGDSTATTASSSSSSSSRTRIANASSWGTTALAELEQHRSKVAAGLFLLQGRSCPSRKRDCTFGSKTTITERRASKPANFDRPIGISRPQDDAIGGSSASERRFLVPSEISTINTNEIDDQNNNKSCSSESGERTERKRRRLSSSDAPSGGDAPPETRTTLEEERLEPLKRLRALSLSRALLGSMSPVVRVHQEPKLDAALTTLAAKTTTTTTTLRTPELEETEGGGN